MKAELRTLGLIVGIGFVVLLTSCARTVPSDSYSYCAGPFCAVEDLPAFAWPPARPSDVVDLTKYFPRSAYPDYASIAEMIQETAEINQNPHLTVYGLRNSISGRPMRGFVMVSRIEEIDSNGGILSPRHFIDREIKPRNLGFWNIISALFYAPRGHYRVILFAVTADVQAGAPQPPTGQEALVWALGGARHLGSYGQTSFEPGELVYAYVYQFEKTTARASATLGNELISGRTHLVQSGFDFSRTNQ